MPLVPVFFWGGIAYLGLCLLSPFFFKDLGVHLGVSQGHTHQWGLMGLGCKENGTSNVGKIKCSLGNGGTLDQLFQFMQALHGETELVKQA